MSLPQTSALSANFNNDTNDSEADADLEGLVGQVHLEYNSPAEEPPPDSNPERTALIWSQCLRKQVMQDVLNTWHAHMTTIVSSYGTNALEIKLLYVKAHHLDPAVFFKNTTLAAIQLAETHLLDMDLLISPNNTINLQFERFAQNAFTVYGPEPLEPAALPLPAIDTNALIVLCDPMSPENEYYRLWKEKINMIIQRHGAFSAEATLLHEITENHALPLQYDEKARSNLLELDLLITPHFTLKPQYRSMALQSFMWYVPMRALPGSIDDSYLIAVNNHISISKHFCQRPISPAKKEDTDSASTIYSSHLEEPARKPAILHNLQACKGSSSSGSDAIEHFNNQRFRG